MIGRGGSAILAPDGEYLAGPLYDEEGSSTRSSTPTGCWRSASDSIQSATTTGPMCCT